MKVLANRHAIVTGGAQGIGLGIAHSLARGGARVILWDIAVEVFAAADRLSNDGCPVLAARVDVARMPAVQAALREAEQTLGPVDILVNNAGIARFAPFVDMTEADRDLVLDVNFNGTWNCSRAVLPGMMTRHYGRIINIASVTGPRVGDPGLCAYASAKGAVTGLTRNLAIEVAASGVTVNAVLPGFIDTPLMQPLADAMGMSVDDARQTLAQANPVNRLGTVDDIGGLCVFLASEASGYITGQEFVIDGGGTLLERAKTAEQSA